MSTSAPGFSWSETGVTVPERFARVVARYPEQVAVTDGSLSLTYRRLDERSNLLAAALVSQQGAGSEPIALLCEHDVTAIVAVLGVIKAGKFYLPLDARQPKATLRSQSEDAGALMLLTDAVNRTLADAIAPQGCHVALCDDLIAGGPGTIQHDTSDPPAITADSAAILGFTSGSTGAPKGGLRSHRRLLASGWHHAHHYGLGLGDRIALVFHIAGGGSGADIVAALLTGATLCLFDVRHHNVLALVRWLEADAITFLHCPVPLFRELADLLLDVRPALALHHVMLAGQTVTHGDVELFRRCFPVNTILVVRLAISEAGPVSHFVIGPETSIVTATVPVGYALEGSEILILDAEGAPVMADETGEIAVRGLYVSPGYWRQPEETRVRFTTSGDGGGRQFLTGDLGRMHADGCLEHLGRSDHMVKIRGYRVELGAVEAALRALPSVKEAAVLAHTVTPGDERLVAFIASRGAVQPTSSELRRSLAVALPDYMIPAHFVFMAALPLTSGGKVDRGQLRQHVNLLPRSRPRPGLDAPYVAPASATETEMVAIWADVLGYDLVGIHDRFLDLGGNSILAARIMARVIRAFAVDIPLQALLETPTAVALAALVDEQLANMGNNGDIRQLLAAIEALSDSEAKSLLEGTTT